MPASAKRPRGRAKTDPRHQKVCPDNLPASRPSPSTKLPTELQQLMLNLLSNTFSSHIHDKLSSVQEIKQHLFKRDFTAAFSKEAYRETYALRWSASRALAYIHIFSNLAPLVASVFSEASLHASRTAADPSVQDQILEAFVKTPSDSEPPSVASQTAIAKKHRVVCVGGGGGAELLAFGGLLRNLNGDTAARKCGAPGEGSSPSPFCLDIAAIDIADWSSVIHMLHNGITTAPPLAPYASSEARAANVPLVPADSCTVDFVKQDILDMHVDDVGAKFQDAALVTLMFTLNELYSTSLSATTNLLLSLTLVLSPETLLLIVDSPGSYSTVNIGNSPAADHQAMEKCYPMQWLLDHTLLESAAISSSKKTSGEQQWEKIESRDSEWFRLSKELRYPIDLEDMRYQLHLYRRL